MGAREALTRSRDGEGGAAGRGARERVTRGEETTWRRSDRRAPTHGRGGGQPNLLHPRVPLQGSVVLLACTGLLPRQAAELGRLLVLPYAQQN